MASYADLTESFKRGLKIAQNMRRCLTDVTNGSNSVDSFDANSEALREDTPDYSVKTQAGVVAALKSLREEYAKLPERGRAVVDPTLVEIGKLIGSPSIVNDAIQDRARFWRDWRDYQENTADERVTGRAVTFASDPTDSSKGWFRRLTVDHNGQKIENGRFNNTVTAQLTQKTGTFQGSYELTAGDGATDALDYLGALGGVLGTLAPVSRGQPSTLIQNPTLLGSANTDNADQTINGPWVQTVNSGTPIVKVDKTNVFQQGLSTTAYSASFSGATGASSVKYAQPIPSAVLANPYAPVLPYLAVMLKGSWTGAIAIEWGGESQSFTEADLTVDTWVPLFVTRDADLYPINFDEASAEFAFTIASDSGLSASDEVVIGFADMLPLQGIGNIFYGAAMADVEPDLQDSVSWADSITVGGDIQDTLAFLYQDTDAGAFLNTTGTNLLADF